MFMLIVTVSYISLFHGLHQLVTVSYISLLHGIDLLAAMFHGPSPCV